MLDPPLPGPLPLPSSLPKAQEASVMALKPRSTLYSDLVLLVNTMELYEGMGRCFHQRDHYSL